MWHLPHILENSKKPFLKKIFAKTKSYRVINKIDISSLMIAVFDLDSWNSVTKTGLTQGIRIWNQKLQFLKITGSKPANWRFQNRKKLVAREKYMWSTVFKITGWNLVYKLILGRELRVLRLIWHSRILNASNQGMKSHKSKKWKNGLFNVQFEPFVTKTPQSWFQIWIQPYEIRLKTYLQAFLMLFAPLISSSFFWTNHFCWFFNFSFHEN